MSLVKLNQTVKTFGGLRAVDDVSFSIDRGEVVGFLGPNGAGKTTTMRLITAILEPDSGSVEVSGVPVGENSLEVKRKIGYLPENHKYPDYLTGEQVLQYFGRLSGMSDAETSKRTSELLDIVGGANARKSAAEMAGPSSTGELS